MHIYKYVSLNSFIVRAVTRQKLTATYDEWFFFSSFSPPFFRQNNIYERKLKFISHVVSYVSANFCEKQRFSNTLAANA